MTREKVFTKHDLRPFTRVLAKNGKIGVLIRFNDADAICFDSCVILMNAYNVDLTLKHQYSIIPFNNGDDEVMTQYYVDLLCIEDYDGYEIVDINEIDDFNLLNKMINFNVVAI